MISKTIQLDDEMFSKLYYQDIFGIDYNNY